MVTRRTRANQTSAATASDNQNAEPLSESSSTETIIHVETSDEENSLSSTVNRYQYNPEKRIFKLNTLEDKSARYQSHMDFLNKCIDEKLVPNGLKIELEP